VPADANDSTGGSRLDFGLGQIEFTLRRLARTTGDRDRAQDRPGGQQFRRKRFQATGTQPPSFRPAMCCTSDRHDHASEATRALLAAAIKVEFPRNAAIMARKFESNSNSYDE
jgi:hypothetical protein